MTTFNTPARSAAGVEARWPVAYSQLAAECPCHEGHFDADCYRTIVRALRDVRTRDLMTLGRARTEP